MFFGRCNHEFVIQIVTHNLSVHSFARIAHLQWDCSQMVHLLPIVVLWAHPSVVSVGSGSSGCASSVISHLRCGHLISAQIVHPY